MLNIELTKDSPDIEDVAQMLMEIKAEGLKIEKLNLTLRRDDAGDNEQQIPSSGGLG